MPSQSLQDYQVRLKEIQQLLDAHSALTRLRVAEAALKRGNKDLRAISDVVDALVSDPGRGRRYDVQALNSAAIALLSAHLQGFVVDIFEESAKALFVGRPAEDVQALIDVAPGRGNPNSANIIKLFRALGFVDILDGISWPRMDNKALRRKLDQFTTLRNQIVHGRSGAINRTNVESYYNSWSTFGEKFDAHVTRKISRTIGRAPW